MEDSFGIGLPESPKRPIRAQELMKHQYKCSGLIVTFEKLTLGARGLLRCGVRRCIMGRNFGKVWKPVKTLYPQA
jgi:hypothetical protein